MSAKPNFIEQLSSIFYGLFFLLFDLLLGGRGNVIGLSYILWKLWDSHTLSKEGVVAVIILAAILWTYHRIEFDFICRLAIFITFVPSEGYPGSEYWLAYLVGYMLVYTSFLGIADEQRKKKE